MAERRPLYLKLVWFAGLWLMGVLALSAVAFAIKLVLGI